MPGIPGQAGAPSTIDQRLCLTNIPTFIAEDRIKELLSTFGQLKFFAMQKDDEGKSVGVAFFEYVDMMTQTQARNALEGLQLGQNRLSVRRPEEVIELGLVNREQKLGNRILPSKVIYLKNIVVAEELKSKREYEEICADIRLEGEKFGVVLSIEVPRPRKIGGAPESDAEDNGPVPDAAEGAVVPLGSIVSGQLTGAVAKAKPPKQPKPEKPSDTMALVLAGSIVPNSSTALANPGDVSEEEEGVTWEFDVPGLGYAFIEFSTVEGASKAKKGLAGRKFGENLVEAEYFSESLYLAKQLADPRPNTETPLCLDDAAAQQFAEIERGMLAEADKPLMLE